MAGNYPWGVTDNDPHFNDCSERLTPEEEDNESYEAWLERVSHICDACRFRNHAACEIAVDIRRPLDICKCACRSEAPSC